MSNKELVSLFNEPNIVATLKSQTVREYKMNWIRLESWGPTHIDYHEMKTKNKSTEGKA